MADELEDARLARLLHEELNAPTRRASRSLQKVRAMPTSAAHNFDSHAMVTTTSLALLTFFISKRFQAMRSSIDACSPSCMYSGECYPQA